jgi:toxin ParE1/3/4
MAKRGPLFEFHPEAILEAIEATEWYAERSPNAERRFKAELRIAESRVTQRPDAWNLYLHGTRCCQLNRFPFGLVYIQRGEKIIGIAVAHFKRRPGYWRKRLKD